MDAVDEPPCSSLVQAAAIKFLMGIQITVPAAMAGLAWPDLEKEAGFPTNILEKAFLRRALELANAVHSARVANKTGGGSQAASSQLVPVAAPVQAPDFSFLQQQLSLSGNEVSAHVVAAGLLQTAVVPRTLLAAVNVTLPHTSMADASVFQLLDAERRSAAAAVPTRQAFSFLDLTSRELLPIWMTQDMIGGRMLLAGESSLLDGTGAASTVAALGQALRAATSTPRFFSSFQQWSVVFMPYLPVAVACTHLTWGQGLNYFGMIGQLAEEERVSAGHSYLAFVYDEMTRKAWASRVRAGDVVDFEAETVCRDKTMLDLARARLDLVLQHAGLAPSDMRRSHGGQSGAQSSGSNGVNLDGAYAKQQAAAEALKRKAENASRELSKQQVDMEQRQAALFQGPGHKQRDQRRNSFLENVVMQRGNGGKGGGKGGKNGGGGKVRGQQWHSGSRRTNFGKGKGSW